MAEEAEQVLRQNRRERDWFIAFHASWLRKQGIIQVQPASAGGQPPGASGKA